MVTLGVMVFVLGCDQMPDSRTKNSAESFKCPPESTTTALRSDLGQILDLLRSGPTGAARIRLRKILDQNPTDGQAAFLYGLSLHQEKRYSEARVYFGQALGTLLNTPPPTIFWVGVCSTKVSWNWRGPASRLHITLVEGEGDDHFAMGLIALEQNNLAVAEDHFKTALLLQNPADFNGQARAQGKTFARLGELAEVLGNLDLAAERLSKATELFPDHYEAWHRLAAIERRRGNQDAAARAANQEAAARDRVGRPQGFPE